MLWVCLCMHMHMKGRSQHWMSPSVILQLSLWDQILLILNSIVSPFSVLGIPMSLPSQFWDLRYVLVFLVLQGCWIWTKIPMIARQTLYGLSHLCNPMRTTFYCWAWTSVSSSKDTKLEFYHCKMLNYIQNLIELTNESFSSPLHQRLAQQMVDSGLVRPRAEKLARLIHELQKS